MYKTYLNKTCKIAKQLKPHILTEQAHILITSEADNGVNYMI